MATERQVSYLIALRDGKALDTLTDAQRDWLGKLTPDNAVSLDTKTASRVIEQLVPLPWKPKEQQASNNHPEIKDGRYAIYDDDGVLKFYSVKRWKKNPDKIFVDVWASDTRYPIKNYQTREAILTAIERDPDAGPRFGREIGDCYVCGRTLTDEESRRLGIGPICREGR